MTRAGLVWLAIMCGLGLRAQQLLFDRITTADGLPSDEANALFEDRDGYIWVGTADGLARFEGTRIRVFHHDHSDSTSLAHDQVNGVTQDAQGTLWFATMDGLARFDSRRGTFVNQRVQATGNNARQANRMRQVLAIGDSLLWVVTEAGLYRYDIGKAAFHAMQGLPAGDGPAGLIIANSALSWDAQRRILWTGTQKGLASWDARSHRWTDHRNAGQEPWLDTSVTDAPIVRGDSIWFFRNKPYTLFAFDLRRGSLQAQPDVEAQPNLFTLACQSFDPDGRHWLSTWTHRLFQRQQGAPWQEVRASKTEPGSITSARVIGMLHTRWGESWFATTRGVSILRRGSVSLTLLPFDIAPYDVSVLRQAGQDTLLIGTTGGGVRVLNIRSGTSTPLVIVRPGEVEGAAEQANLVRDIAPERNGHHLVCTAYGMAELDARIPVLRRSGPVMERIPGSDELSFSFAVEEQDVLWLGTWSSGLWRCEEGGTCVRVDTVPGTYGELRSPMMLSWLKDAKGRSWVGMNNGGGLACLENGRFHAITDASGANVGGVVRQMAEGPDGRIWLGTHEQGIVVFDPTGGGTRYVSRRDGLPGACILGMRFMRDSSLWVATRQGIACMAKGATTFQAFLLPSGLHARSITGAMEELPDGRIAFGIDGRILLHDPGRTATASSPIPVLTGYRVNDEWNLGAPPALTLSAGRKALTLELGSLGGHANRSPVFRYRLDANDTAWQEIGAAQRIDLFDLAPGAYAVEVQASSNGVEWSAALARATVEVLPPFHATWWFRTVVWLVIAGLMLLGFKLYLRERLRKQREAFEREQAVLAERMRIAGDMHDDLGAGLSALKLRSEMALRVEKDPVKREQLASLASTAGDLIGSMRQIIWTMNADQSTIADLVSYTTNYTRGYCAENGLELRIATPPTWPELALSSEQRRNVFLVVKEALHNVVKHANASEVRLTLGLGGNDLVVEVEDNGTGLPGYAENSVGNGLRNMRKRIAKLGGAFRTDAAAGMPGRGSGALIHFSIPVVVANQGSIGTNGAAGDIRRP